LRNGSAAVVVFSEVSAITKTLCLRIIQVLVMMLKASVTIDTLLSWVTDPCLWLSPSLSRWRGGQGSSIIGERIWYEEQSAWLPLMT
jgi:hypothetical protein